ncbi:hypothetical protein XANCAGTX0491_007285 [Xanthoria calcicola]
MVALSVADGFARYTNKPQAVIVHTDVGTQALGPAVHNASCGRVPVLIFAGLSPYTLEGEIRGSRSSSYTGYRMYLTRRPSYHSIVDSPPRSRREETSSSTSTEPYSSLPAIRKDPSI